MHAGQPEPGHAGGHAFQNERIFQCILDARAD